MSFEIPAGTCSALPDDWTNTVTSMGHSDCVIACFSRNCQGVCVEFTGQANADFSNSDNNDKFNSFRGC